MSAVSMIRDQWIRRHDGHADGLDVSAYADQRHLATEYPHGEYRITVMTGDDMSRLLAGDKTAGTTYRPATLEEFTAKLAEVRTGLRADGWTLESSKDEWPGT